MGSVDANAVVSLVTEETTELLVGDDVRVDWMDT